MTSSRGRRRPQCGQLHRQLIVQVTARCESNGVEMLMSVSTPGRSHHSDPSLVEQGQIASHQVEGFGRVGVLWTRALDVSLAAKLVRQRPRHSIDDKVCALLCTDSICFFTGSKAAVNTALVNWAMCWLSLTAAATPFGHQFGENARA